MTATNYTTMCDLTWFFETARSAGPVVFMFGMFGVLRNRGRGRIFEYVLYSNFFILHGLPTRLASPSFGILATQNVDTAHSFHSFPDYFLAFSQIVHS